MSRVVLESLGEVSDDRRCFRMVGGVLVERTVAEVVPALSNNRDKVGTNVAELIQRSFFYSLPLNKIIFKGIKVILKSATGGKHQMLFCIKFNILKLTSLYF